MASGDFYPPYIPRGLRLPETSVWTNLEISAKRYPSKPAFICYDNAITFARLLVWLPKPDPRLTKGSISGSFFKLIATRP